MAVQHGWVERFYDDQLIVPIAQLGAVLKALPDCVQINSTEENRALGLARLSKLSGIHAAVGELERDDLIGRRLEAYRELRRTAHPEAPAEVPELDLVIHGVKAKLAHEYPGWQIVIGKNYAPSGVQGDPHTDGAGHPDPHTDGADSPTVTSSDCTGPIVQPDPHTDIERKRTGAGEPGRPVRVGLVDTKLFPHESLTGHYLGRPEDILPPPRPVYTELDGHCTFVASCILRQAPDATLYVRHALDEHGETSAWHAAVAIAELAPEDPDVVNLSFGQYMTDDDSAPMVLDAAIRRFGRGTVVVASAGNNGGVTSSRPAGLPEGVTSGTTSYPAALPGVVGVGAVDAHDERARFTPDPAPWISLLARGVSVNAAYLRGDVQVLHEEKPTEFQGFANWSGCSFAAGVVSGIIAARTEPGGRTARQTLEELMAALRKNPWPGLLINPELLIK